MKEKYSYTILYEERKLIMIQLKSLKFIKIYLFLIKIIFKYNSQVKKLLIHFSFIGTKKIDFDSIKIFKIHENILILNKIILKYNSQK